MFSQITRRDDFVRGEIIEFCFEVCELNGKI
jgi:hypothetical protein